MKVKVRNTKGSGRGVFATQDIKKGTLIEKSPVLIFPPKHRKILEKTQLNYYVYPWKSLKSAAIVLGFGSIYNHSYHPNADWKQDFKAKAMEYRALRDIKKGEEILVNYNGEPDDKSPIDWFGEENKSRYR